MGVPGLYRWLCERYPKCLQAAIESVSTSDNSNPNGDIDNLYLDMNGIIHSASHPEHIDPPSNESEIFIAVFKHIDRIFSVIRPKKLLFLAVDGVAPRAKLNHQRARRYRTAKNLIAEEELEENRHQARCLWYPYNGLPVPVRKPPAWDYNAITPGTPFMDSLSQHLRFYIHDRLSNHADWRELAIILSDSSVPGEGEHKIMDFVRQQRYSSNYDPNTVHAVLGNDADLILLCLATHELHFTVVREVDRRPPHRATTTTPAPASASNHGASHGDTGPRIDAPPLRLLRIGVLREYLDRELCGERVSFPPCLENAVDDFILLCSLCGNDFLPSVPAFEIREGGLDEILDVYKQASLPGGVLDGYLTQAASTGSGWQGVHYGRCAGLLGQLALLEGDILRARAKRLAAEARRAAGDDDDFGFSAAAVPSHIFNPAATPFASASDSDCVSVGCIGSGSGSGSVSVVAASGSDELNFDTLNLDLDAPRAPVAVGLEVGVLPCELVAGGANEHPPALETVAVNPRLLRVAQSGGGDWSPNGAAASSITTSGGGSGMGGGGRIRNGKLLAIQNQGLMRDPGNPEGWVDAATLAAFPRMRQLGARVEDLLAAARASMSPAGLEACGGEGSGGLIRIRRRAPLPAVAVLVDFRREHFRSKLGVDVGDAAGAALAAEVSARYLEGMEWAWLYYHRGCPCWAWYYPYHHGPFASDLAAAAAAAAVDDGVAGGGTAAARPRRFRPEDAGAPLRPLEQLLACLPPRSAGLLPAPLRELMGAGSPLAGFFPDDFEEEPLEPGRPAWAAVVRLPYVDAGRLAEEARRLEPALSDEERARNRPGAALVLLARGGAPLRARAARDAPPAPADAEEPPPRWAEALAALAGDPAPDAPPPRAPLSSPPPPPPPLAESRAACFVYAPPPVATGGPEPDLKRVAGAQPPLAALAPWERPVAGYRIRLGPPPGRGRGGFGGRGR